MDKSQTKQVLDLVCRNYGYINIPKKRYKNLCKSLNKIFLVGKEDPRIIKIYAIRGVVIKEEGWNAE